MSKETRYRKYRKAEHTLSLEGNETTKRCDNYKCFAMEIFEDEKCDPGIQDRVNSGRCSVSTLSVMG
jgi:hypothetical protein